MKSDKYLLKSDWNLFTDSMSDSESESGSDNDSSGPSESDLSQVGEASPSMKPFLWSNDTSYGYTTG